LNLGMRVERGAALLASMLANQVRDSKRRPEPYTPDDFMRHGDQVVASLELAMATWT